MSTSSTTPSSAEGGVLDEAKHLLVALQDAIQKELENIKNERSGLEKERASYEEMKTRIAAVHFSDPIKLDVGGRIFKTSKATLTKETSMLSQMFSGSGFKVEKDEDGAYFIDRSGAHFDTILNYLRNGELILPSDPAAVEELKIEADFYQVRIC